MVQQQQRRRYDRGNRIWIYQRRLEMDDLEGFSQDLINAVRLILAR